MADRLCFRAQILHNHLHPTLSPPSSSLSASPCLAYSPADLSEPPPAFDTNRMRALLDVHNIEHRDWLFNVMIQSNLFNPTVRGHRTFVCPDYNQSMEQQREITMRRIEYLRDCGVFKGWLTGEGEEAEMRKMALNEELTSVDIQPHKTSNP
ncbi:hypothetical protein Cgig2_012273 [Carnegiea gigantea]|uniref:Uncharacterized protein n=1 Tax=Carnegiea gigantea TaxID=171969 RepID=A0A9Q1K2J6_9CARY|nr:hypothetical protein Cgig2_012273 [Carnegiea gigantea]